MDLVWSDCACVSALGAGPGIRLHAQRSADVAGTRGRGFAGFTRTGKSGRGRFTIPEVDRRLSTRRGRRLRIWTPDAPSVGSESFESLRRAVARTWRVGKSERGIL